MTQIPMETPHLEKNQNIEESFPKVLINPQETFPSKLTPIFASDITDVATGEKIGRVDFQLNRREKTIIVQSVVIDKPRQGYGVALYRLLQSLYPEYLLQSSEQMIAKTDEFQDKPNAVYLWEKLVHLGYAEKNERGGFRMKTNSNMSSGRLV